MNLEGKRDRSSQLIKDEDGNLLRDVELIRERWVRWFHTLLNTKSPKLDPKIAEALDQWPVNTPLGVHPTMQELIDVIHSSANGKAVDREESPSSYSRSPSTVTLPCDKDFSTSSLAFGGGERFRNSGTIPLSRCSTRRRI